MSAAHGPARAQLITGQRLAVLGGLASSLGHEINNPNTVILLNAKLLQKICADLWPMVEAQVRELGDVRIGGLTVEDARATVEQATGHIVDSGQRIAQVIANLRGLSRTGGGAQLVGLNPLVEQAIALLEPMVRRSTDALRLTLAAAGSKVHGQPQALLQVIVGLVHNALAALPARDRALTVGTAVDPDGAPRLWIEDQGVGMSAELLARVGEPFFSTRTAEGALGLGLYVAREVMRDHGGALAITSTVGQGTRVELRFPNAALSSAP